MVNKNYKLPAIVWLRVTDYMHAWIQWELCGNLRVKNQKVVSLQHLPGARDAMRMETEEGTVPHRQIGNTMSATFRNALEAGMAFDPHAMEREYGLTKEHLKLFIPIECPKMCLTRNGVLRPWTPDTAFGSRQASAIQRLIRDAFWRSVREFSDWYAREHRDDRYAQAEMIAAFCQNTNTPDVYVDAIRREWQRRVKRIKNACSEVNSE